MLTLDEITKSFGGAHPRGVLNKVSLSLQPGEYVAVMGESGVGKSTLLNLIAGLDSPDSGRIVFDGHDISGLADNEATLFRRRSMGFVFQAFHVLPYLSVAQNVALPLLLNGAVRRDAMLRATAMLVEVGLSERDNSLPRELSGGEMQRVAIARALVHQPRLLLADEPTGNLDADTASQILALLRERIKHSATPTAGLLVTHSARAAATADRILVLTARGLVAPRSALQPAEAI